MGKSKLRPPISTPLMVFLDQSSHFQRGTVGPYLSSKHGHPGDSTSPPEFFNPKIFFRLWVYAEGGTPTHVHRSHPIFAPYGSDWTGIASFWVLNRSPGKRGSYGPPNLGKISKNLKTAPKNTRGWPKITLPRLWLTLGGIYNLHPKMTPHFAP